MVSKGGGGLRYCPSKVTGEIQRLEAAETPAFLFFVSSFIALCLVLSMPIRHYGLDVMENRILGGLAGIATEGRTRSLLWSCPALTAGT